MNPHEWSDLMKGFIPPDKSDYSSTGTFDTGGPSLDNYRYEHAIQSESANESSDAAGIRTAQSTDDESRDAPSSGT